MRSSSGKFIAILGFAGGLAVIRGMMSYQIKTGYLVLGGILILISFVLFIKQIRNIK